MAMVSVDDSSLQVDSLPWTELQQLFVALHIDHSSDECGELSQ